MKSVGAIDYLLADGSIVTITIPVGNIFEHFEGGAYALLNTELTDCCEDESKAISVPEFRAGVEHVIIRLGDDSTLTKGEDGSIGVSIELGGDVSSE